jgi:hypothetical protein
MVRLSNQGKKGIEKHRFCASPNMQAAMNSVAAAAAQKITRYTHAVEMVEIIRPPPARNLRRSGNLPVRAGYRIPGLSLAPLFAAGHIPCMTLSRIIQFSNRFAIREDWLLCSVDASMIVYGGIT